MRTWTCLILMTILFGSTLFFAGCTHSVNERVEIGTQRATHSFVENPAVGLALGASAESRSEWEPIRFMVPIDGIAHNPTMLLLRYPRKNELPRSYGLFPDARSSIDAQQTRPLDQLLSGPTNLLAWGRWILDPFVYWSRIRSNTWSPQQVWKRTQQDTSWSTGPAGHHTVVQTTGLHESDQDRESDQNTVLFTKEEPTND
ncbi:MAG: hypothetical protein AB8C13_09065 [Phycisphaerales bacterium]